MKKRYSAKETYHIKEPTNRSHPIMVGVNCRQNHVDWHFSAQIPLEQRFNEKKTFTEIVGVNGGVKWEGKATSIGKLVHEIIDKYET